MFVQRHRVTEGGGEAEGGQCHCGPAVNLRPDLFLACLNDDFYQ